ncbi:hypothetical protein [Sphingomonas naphthae]|uniref:hypothetical protein n=1 Tax=Sphingomonas naphthae TaxID=1813468 RepID=UPI003B5BBB29
MHDPLFLLSAMGTTLVSVTVLALVALRGWSGWLDVRRLELEQRHHPLSASPAAANPGARIELADLKERVRKLEAIAAGVDL